MHTYMHNKRASESSRERNAATSAGRDEAKRAEQKARPTAKAHACTVLPAAAAARRRPTQCNATPCAVPRRAAPHARACTQGRAHAHECALTRAHTRIQALWAQMKQEREADYAAEEVDVHAHTHGTAPSAA